MGNLGKIGINNPKIIETIKSFKYFDNPDIRMASIVTMEDLD